jgi:FtsP/CotA-like multicopper oxidase with cupredoxin domain
MKRIKRISTAVLVIAAMLLFPAAGVHAAIDGISGTNFAFDAVPGYISTSDGGSLLMWGYRNAGSPLMQYPGPTLKITQGQTVTITLTNNLPAGVGNTSIVFPGHRATATGGVPGLLTREAEPGGTVAYTFTANEPGTYLYRSGTNPDLQVEMGLVGALIVYPAGGGSAAYNHPESAYDREFLYLLTEMDPDIHYAAEDGAYDQIDTTKFFATNWFINGRNFPDVMTDPGVPWLPSQPYNCQPRMHPGEKVLIRMIGAGIDGHPMHFHGNDFETIAIDGRLLSSGPGNGPDLAWKATTIRSVPGQTADMLWTWTGEGLGWDIYGHAPGDAPVPGEDMEFHGVEFPVVIPPRDVLTFGQFYSGGPFLGGGGDLPPGDPGLNSNAGYFYMWHSHTEKELTSDDIWPGGLVSFMIVEHPNVPLP